MNRENRVAIALILFAVVLMFWQIARGLIPFPGNFMLAWDEPWKTQYIKNGVITIAHKPVVDDAFRILYPFRQLATELLRSGQPPLWNPYQGAGAPLMAVMHTGLLQPFGFIFLLFSPAVAWSVFVVLQLVLLGFGMYTYARCLGLSVRSSLFATFVLVYSGFVCVRLEYTEFLYGLAVLPVLLYLIENTKAHGITLRVFGIPFLIGFLVLSGQPYIMASVLVVASLYAWYRLGAKKRTWLLAALTLLGLGIGAVQLFPTWELYVNSTVKEVEASKFLLDRFLVPPRHLVSVAIPNYFGNHATYNYFGTGGDSIETTAYVGLIPLFLVFILVGTKSTKMRVRRFFVFLVVGAVLYATKWPGATLLHAIPIPILSTEAPSRAFIFVTFGIAILSGFGFEQLARVEKQKLRFLMTAFFVGIFGLIAMTVWYYLRDVRCAVVQVPNCRIISVRNMFLEVGVSGLFFLWLFIVRWKKLTQAWVWAMPFVLVMAIGLYNQYKFLPFSPPSSLFPSNEVLDAIQKHSGKNRFFAVGDARIRANIPTAYHLYDPNYYEPLLIKRYSELISYANTGTHSSVSRSDVEIARDIALPNEAAWKRERLLDLLSVSLVLYKTAETKEQIEAVWHNGEFVLFPRTTSLPRVMITGQYEVMTDDTDLLTRLFDPTWSPDKSVLLETDPHIVQTTGVAGDAFLTHYTEQEITILVHAKGEGLLLLTDTYYPGWTARVDGAATPVYRANYTFRAVKVPSGDHTVQFIYKPQPFVVGVITSIISVVLVVVILLLRIFLPAWRRTRFPSRLRRLFQSL